MAKKKKKNTGEWEWLPWEYVAMTGKGLRSTFWSDSNILCVDGAFITGVCICQTNVHFGYPHLSTVNFIKNTMNTKCIFLLITKTFYFLKLGKDKFGLHENPPQYPFNYCLHVQGSSVLLFLSRACLPLAFLVGKSTEEAAQRLRHFHIPEEVVQITMCWKSGGSKNHNNQKQIR